MQKSLQLCSFCLHQWRVPQYYSTTVPQYHSHTLWGEISMGGGYQSFHQHLRSAHRNYAVPHTPLRIDIRSDSAFFNSVFFTHPFASSLFPTPFSKLCAFEWMQCRSSWPVAMLNRASLPKVPTVPSLISTELGRAYYCLLIALLNSRNGLG